MASLTLKGIARITSGHFLPNLLAINPNIVQLNKNPKDFNAAVQVASSTRIQRSYGISFK